ncbi:hypothetical protein ACVGWB_05140, partial [Enterobacter mori]
AGEEREQEWEFHGSTSAWFFLNPALNQTHRVVTLTKNTGARLWVSQKKKNHPTKIKCENSNDS